MKFCKHCGNKLEKSKKFCVSCGASLVKDAGSSSTEEQLRGRNNQSYSRKTTEKIPMTPAKKKKIILGSAILGVLIVFFSVSAHLTSEDRLVKSFSEAVANQDAGKIKGLLSYRETEAKISDEEAEAFVRYIEANPDEGNRIVESVNDQSEALKGSKATAEEEVWDYLFGTEDALIQLEQDGKFFFFDKHKLYVEPIFIEMETDFAGTKLYNGETEIAEADTSGFTTEIGPFLPGLYTFKAEFANEYMDLKEEREVEVMPSTNGKTLNLSVDASSVTFYSELDGAIPSRLIINGEPVEFNALAKESYGPVVLDGSMDLAVEADFPWGKSRTETVALENGTFDVKFPMDKALKTTLLEALENYTVSYPEAFEKGDAQLVESMHSDLEAAFLDEVEEYNQEEYIYKKELSKLDLDTENFHLLSEEDALKAIVYLRETASSDYYHQDNEAFLEEEESYWEYQFTFVENQWVLTGKYNEPWSPVAFDKVETVLTEPLSITLDNSVEVTEEKEEKEEGGSLEAGIVGLDKEAVQNILQEKIDSVSETMLNLGIEHNWHSQQPGDYSVIKPEILPFVTEDFAEGTIKPLAEDFYCECDFPFLPSVNYDVQFVYDVSEDNELNISSLEPANELNNQGSTWEFHLVQEEDTWKINNWETQSLEGKDIELTRDEAERLLNNEHQTARFEEEYESEEAGGTAYVFTVEAGGGEWQTAISSKDTRIVYDHTD